MSPQLITFLSALLPITELRGAIPLGIYLGLSPLEAFFWSVLGNSVPAFFLLAFLDPVSRFLMKNSKFMNKFLKKLFEKTKLKHSHKFQVYGAIFLILFVAIPLPGTGSWTGSLIAFLLGFPYLKSILYITIGVIGAGISVTLAVTGIVEIF